jgi:hypothetical protein
MTPQKKQTETMEQVVKILKSPGCRSVNSPCGSGVLPDPEIVNRKTPVLVKSMETAVEIALAFGKEKSVHPFWLLISWHESFLCRLCPIFRISNVTGEGLDFVSLLSHCPGDDAGLTQIQKQLRTFLNLLPSSEGEEKFTVNQPLEVITYLPLSCCLVESYIVCQYSVTDIWSVPYVGTVVNGIVNGGSVKVGEAVLLGPDSNGNYQNTVIKSMQRKRSHRSSVFF